MPVLVKDGKPCGGGGGGQGGGSGGTLDGHAGRGGQQQSPGAAAVGCPSAASGQPSGQPPGPPAPPPAQCMANTGPAGLAMAYSRSQQATNYQQQCGAAYLPLQARAW